MWAPTSCAAFCLLLAPAAPAPECPRAVQADEPNWVEPDERLDPITLTGVRKRPFNPAPTGGAAERSADDRGPRWNNEPRPALSSEELATLWNDMANPNDLVAARAMLRLIAAPATAVPFVAERLPVAGPIDRNRMARLIADLDDRDFAVRERAAEALEAVGEDARVFLAEFGMAKASAEVRYRVGLLLDRLNGSEPSMDEERVFRGVRVLEEIGTPEALQALNRLACGEPLARRTQEAQAALLRRQ